MIESGEIPVIAVNETAELRGKVNALRQQLATTSSTTSSSTTTTTTAPTTTTTGKQPQGTVTWSFNKTDWYGPPCATVYYDFQNKSDTAVLDVTVSGVRLGKENVPRGPNDPGEVLTGPTFPAQTQPAGIPPWGEKTIGFKWCLSNWPKDPAKIGTMSPDNAYLEYENVGDWQARLTWKWAS